MAVLSANIARGSVLRCGEASLRGARLWSLVITSVVLGVLVYVGTRDWRWLLGAVLILANWPYTLVFFPVNKRLGIERILFAVDWPFVTNKPAMQMRTRPRF